MAVGGFRLRIGGLLIYVDRERVGKEAQASTFLFHIKMGVKILGASLARPCWNRALDLVQTEDRAGL